MSSCLALQVVASIEFQVWDWDDEVEELTKVGPKSMPEDAEIMMAHQQTEEARKAEKHAEEMKLLRAQVEATNMWRDAAISICGIGKAIETFLSSKS
ncbi:hypothetical protein TCAL_16845 [Tigriopus californicus]|uniref:Uncharacterized protein n=1 Tax=Tigriopus californicus TaxID=6832 RepID=A0A553PDY0_TIGCA|nr:hypothetical protein TCAL_16845 [Tigriopus californicus]